MSRNAEYKELTSTIANFERACNEQSQILKSYPRGAMGLVADADKDLHYRDTTQKYNRYFKHLQMLNAKKCKDYKKEYALERAEQRKEREAKQCH